MTDERKGPAAGVIPHVNVEGGSDASAFYQRAFGAKELFRAAAEDGKRLMHCHLEINGGSLMMSDIFPEYGMVREPSANYTLHLQVAGRRRLRSRHAPGRPVLGRPLRQAQGSVRGALVAGDSAGARARMKGPVARPSRISPSGSLNSPPGDPVDLDPEPR